MANTPGSSQKWWWICLGGVTPLPYNGCGYMLYSPQMDYEPFLQEWAKPWICLNFMSSEIPVNSFSLSIVRKESVGIPNTTDGTFTSYGLTLGALRAWTYARCKLGSEVRIGDEFEDGIEEGASTDGPRTSPPNSIALVALLVVTILFNMLNKYSWVT